MVGGPVRSVLEPASWTDSVQCGQTGQGRGVAQGQQPDPQRPDHGRVRADPVHELVREHSEPAGERAQVQRVDVELTGQRRVGRTDDLEAAVQPESVDLIGTQPAPDFVGRLQNAHVEASAHQMPSRRQPGQAGSDDDGVYTVRHHPRVGGKSCRVSSFAPPAHKIQLHGARIPRF